MASIYNVYIADGFADDCDDLIHRCSQISILSYEKFCDIWKEMHFGAIFHGRCSSTELAELSEEVIHIAKRYMIRNSINFEETVAGLFLVYGLLNLQPFPNFASVRFVPDDVAALDRIELEARRTRRQDVLYILGAVLIRGPCQFHVMERERGIEFPIRKYLEGMTTIDNQGVRPKGVFLRQNEELDIIRELGRLNKLYKDAKEALGVSDKSLKYVDDNFANELDTSLKKIIGGSIDNEDEEIHNDEHNPQSQDDMQSIKFKAMKSSVQPMKHLMGIEERKTSTKKSPTKLKEEKSTSKKGQNDSPNKKRQQSSKSCRKRRRKKKIQDESDSEEDNVEYLVLSDTDNDGQDSDDDDDDNDDDEDDDDDDDIEDEPSEDLGHNRKIEVQSLPILDNSTNNETDYEIEFIDFQNSTKSHSSDDANDNGSIRNTSTDKDSGNNNVAVKTGDGDAAAATVSNDNEKFKKPVLNDFIRKRLEKRDQKKPRLQTKFQRMGMLPVANFREKRKKLTVSRKYDLVEIEKKKT